MVLGILVNIGLGNGLVPEGTKPLPKPMLTYTINRIVRDTIQYIFSKNAFDFN